MNKSILGRSIAAAFNNSTGRDSFREQLCAACPSKADDYIELFALCNAVWHAGYHEGLEECEECEE